MKKIESNKTENKPFAIILETKHAGLFNVLLKIEAEVDKKIPVKRVNESDPVRYEYKKVKEVIDKFIVLESVPCVRDYLGNIIDTGIYTSSIVAIKDLVEAQCEGAIVHYMSLEDK